MYAAIVSSQSVVVKKFDCTENPKQARAAKQSFVQEASIMIEMSHPNILKYVSRRSALPMCFH